MKRLMIVLAGCFALSAFGAAEWRTGVRENLWPSLEKMPDYQEHQIGAMTDEYSEPDFKTNPRRMPYLEWFEKPATPNGCCMILVSGGSYNCCCDVALIKIWRDRFTELGYQCVNLVYRTPRPKGLEIYQTAWEDGQRAVRLVRRQAAVRGYDPEKIGVIGMSAGGHLVTMLATSALTPAYARVDEVDDTPCHIAWCIANAPAYNTLGSASGIKCHEDGTLNEFPQVNPCFKFDAKTCPISFQHGAIDPYTPNGSTRCYRELRKMKVPAELHLYADAAHGAHGLDRAVEFLRQMNFDGKLGPESDRRIYTGVNTRREEREDVWPAGRIPDAQANTSNTAFMTWYVPKKLTTKAIQVIFPGGGYGHCNAKGEGLPAAEYFNGKGMTAVVVTYRIPRPVGLPKHWIAWEDARRAIRKVRAEAPARGLDPDRIGAMGFSAGGHLTLMTALSSTFPLESKPIDYIDELPCNVQWAFPIYPAYALTDGADAPNKTRGNAEDAVLVPEFLFDRNTPPMCFIHGDSDPFAAMNSVKTWEKLRRMGISCDLHTLATRKHCFQFKASDDTGSATWLDRTWEFLTKKGFNR